MFKIRVKAKDCDGAESGVATFDVLILKNKASTNNWFINIIQRLIDAFPILKQLLI